MGRGVDAERRDARATEAKTEVAIARIRADVAALHADLFRHGLIVWTGGEVSARVPGADLFVIKPSELTYDRLAPENMILCDLDGKAVDGTPGSDLAPSTDVATHAFVYRAMPEVGGLAHTHSPYAVAWAARGEEIPCVTTTMADEFGGAVPVVPFSTADDEIGRGIVDTLRAQRSRAVLLRGHGPFAAGPTARDAVRAAIVLEDAARAVHLARDGGAVEPLPTDAVDALYERGRSASLAGT
jgi:L-ribulose-5-phosphate 4-epimerase